MAPSRYGSRIAGCWTERGFASHEFSRATCSVVATDDKLSSKGVAWVSPPVV